jgi:multidrug efflux pump subunit AcrA (membrane-fusion protein)
VSTPTPPTSEPGGAPTPAPTGPPTSDTTAGGSAARGRSGGFSGGGSSSRASGGGASTSRAPTAADIASYQSAVDSAQSDLTAAQQAIAQATIVSPIDGTVLSVGVKPGQNAQAASTTQTVVVQGGGGYEATTTVSIDDIPNVQAGQAAAVTPDGSAAPVTGKVVSIATVPITTTTTTNYRVIISLPADAPTVRNGAIGAVGIVTGTATGVSVPSSAITTNGDIHTVTVLDKNTTQQVVVQVGVVGDTWTQVTRGLDAGQQVVLADVNAALPSSATDTSARTAQTANRALFPFGNNATTRTRTP